MNKTTARERWCGLLSKSQYNALILTLLTIIILVTLGISFEGTTPQRVFIFLFLAASLSGLSAGELFQRCAAVPAEEAA